MVIGAFYLMVVCFIRVGGFGALVDAYSYSTSNSIVFSNSSCGLVKNDYFNLLRDVDADLPWTGMSFGLLISAIWVSLVK
jgi:hypothetical protein